MLYFVPDVKEYDSVEDLGELVAGSPLIPSFPIDGVDCDYFIGADAHGKVRNAVVKNLDVDPDTLLTSAVQKYPGIPGRLLEDYIINSCVAASKSRKSVSYQCIVDGTKAMIRSVDDKRTQIPLWECVDPKNYL